MKELFIKYLNESIPIVYDEYPNWIFYVYDKYLARQKKLNRILNKKTEIHIDLKNCDFLFEHHPKTKKLYVSYKKIWSIYSTDLDNSQIEKMIKRWIKDKKYSVVGVDIDHSWEGMSKNFKILSSLDSKKGISKLNVSFKLK